MLRQSGRCHVSGSIARVIRVQPEVTQMVLRRGRVVSAVAGVAVTAVLGTLALPALAAHASDVAPVGASAGPGPSTSTSRPIVPDPRHPYRHGIVWLRGSAAAAAARA